MGKNYTIVFLEKYVNSNTFKIINVFFASVSFGKGHECILFNISHNNELDILEELVGKEFYG